MHGSRPGAHASSKARDDAPALDARARGGPALDAHDHDPHDHDPRAPGAHADDARDPRDLDARALLEALRAVRRGDFGTRLPGGLTGVDGEIAETFNDVVEINETLVAEIQRLSAAVRDEGRTSARISLPAARGDWAVHADCINALVSDTTHHLAEMARVVSAVSRGDLVQKIDLDAGEVPVRGDFLRYARMVNGMVEQLGIFGSEVTRVAREVGVDGKLGAQADVKGVSGTWKELTDHVNLMASNLTDQVRDIAQVTTAVANGDLSRKITVEVKGEILDLKNTINTMVDSLSAFGSEVTRMAREVGTEGMLGGQAEVRNVSGIWKDLTENVNQMADNLTNQVRNIAEVATSIADGDLSRKITVEAKGEILELKNTINTMVDQLRSFADEVTRVAREVGTEGVLGGQAEVRGVSGTWRDLTDNVNIMAQNLTGQVRGIARVVTAVANGDLKQELTLDAKGEIATLVDTINDMIVTLSTFADQVTNVARDVGLEGKLGGQADVPGAAGIWRNLTNNVNELAGNLTAQVRAIGDVATAVTAGDLTRTIDVEARGEVALLKDNVNQMIRSLAETTRINEEQDWLKTNLAKFTRMLQGQRDLNAVARKVLSDLAPVVNAQHGAFYMARNGIEGPRLTLFSTYAYHAREGTAREFRPGEGLVGQCALEKRPILIPDAPAGYIEINSGMGRARPLNIAIVPILFEKDVKGVIELASFQPFTRIQLNFLEQLLESLGIVVATIEAQMRTDELLKQSQSLTEELRSQQEELQQKAEQLALTSRYKSEFLANMSHELRTPLNSLLILSQQLAENGEGNLTERQVEFARNIRSSGGDLLSLINEVLDLAKIESGTMAVDIGEVNLARLKSASERSFRQIAEDKALAFSVVLDEALPATIRTDGKRLQQVLRNLLSNAFKFTDEGSVTLRIRTATHGWRPDRVALNAARTVVAFAVTDTGIGIPKDRQRLIFEAFQQAEGGASRKYEGTGLGLSISREIARLLGGDLRVQSAPGRGSTFTLFLPAHPAAGVTPAPGRGRRPSEAALALEPPAPTLAEVSPAPDFALESEGPDPALEPTELASGLASGLASELAGELAPGRQTEAHAPAHAELPPALTDDRNALQDGAPTLLLIEDDEKLAGVLLDQARRKGFKALLALEGASGWALASEHRPDAILLDVELPDISGWVLLDRLKHDLETRHIPVHVIARDSQETRALREGAAGCLTRPDEAALDAVIEGRAAALDDLGETLVRVSDRLRDPRRRLLLVHGEHANGGDRLVEMIGGDRGGVSIVSAPGAEEALSELGALDASGFDCAVIDLAHPHAGAAEIVRAIGETPRLRRLPIVLYREGGPTLEEREEIESLAADLVVTLVDSPERLLDETSLLLHRVVDDLEEPGRNTLRALHRKEPALAGRTVLVVDDDIRNIYAMTSILEQHRLVVLNAESGRQALAMLERHSAIEGVLMDIMMPDMNGYEAMRAIRAQERFRELPIIAVTARAMRRDRENCREAGASDYITKPIDAGHLLSLLRVWLVRRAPQS